VWVDLRERDKILAHADLIREHMEAGQEKREDRWFDGTWVHTDFPSGEATGTTLHNGACVFLDSSRRCVLQKASQTLQLKPWFCFAFPITIEDGELMVDDEKAFDPNCCTTDAEGVLNVFEVCPEELKHVLGAEGLQELEQLAADRMTTPDSERG
jgi:hypothetical protein